MLWITLTVTVTLVPYMVIFTNYIWYHDYITMKQTGLYLQYTPLRRQYTLGRQVTHMYIGYNCEGMNAIWGK